MSLFRTGSIAAIVVVIVILTGSVASVVQAGTVFDGQTVSAEWDVFTLGSIFQGPYNAVVGPGAEFSFASFGSWTVDVSDTNILLDFSNSPASVFLNVAFNGNVFKDVFNTIPDFTSVTINPATNMVGFDSSHISFSANEIDVNMAGLSFDSNTIVSLDVTGASAVPLPSAALSGLSLLACLGGVGVIRRRRVLYI